MTPPDPAEQLQRLYLAGFDLQTFDRFPKCVGVIRDNCIALLVPRAGRLASTRDTRLAHGRSHGRPDRIGRGQVFQAKQETVEATPERLAKLRQFQNDLGEQLSSDAS